MPRLALMTPEPEPATWRARFATFRADLDGRDRP
jgi:hypothetical protein